MAYSRVDEYGRRIDPSRPPLKEIPQNRNNEQKPSIDTWMAPPLRKAENPALNNAVEMAGDLASVHLFLDKGEAGLINDGDPRMHLHRNGGPSVIIDGGADARYPMPEQPLGEKMLQKIDPRFNQQMQQKMHQMLQPPMYLS